MPANTDAQIRFEPRDPETSIAVHLDAYDQFPYLERTLETLLTQEDIREVRKLWLSSSTFRRYLGEYARPMIDYIVGQIPPSPYSGYGRDLIGKGKYPSRSDGEWFKEAVVEHRGFPGEQVTIAPFIGLDSEGVYSGFDYSGPEAAVRSVQKTMREYPPFEVWQERRRAPPSPNLLEAMWLLDTPPDVGSLLQDITGWRQSAYFNDFIDSVFSKLDPEFYLSALYLDFYYARSTLTFRIRDQSEAYLCFDVIRGDTPFARICFAAPDNGFVPERLSQFYAADISIEPAEGIDTEDPAYRDVADRLISDVYNLSDPFSGREITIRQPSYGWQLALRKALGSLAAYIVARGESAYAKFPRRNIGSSFPINVAFSLRGVPISEGGSRYAQIRKILAAWRDDPSYIESVYNCTYSIESDVMYTILEILTESGLSTQSPTYIIDGDHRQFPDYVKSCEAVSVGDSTALRIVLNDYPNTHVDLSVEIGLDYIGAYSNLRYSEPVGPSPIALSKTRSMISALFDQRIDPHTEFGSDSLDLDGILWLVNNTPDVGKLPYILKEWSTSPRRSAFFAEEYPWGMKRLLRERFVKEGFRVEDTDGNPLCLEVRYEDVGGVSALVCLKPADGVTGDGLVELLLDVNVDLLEKANQGTFGASELEDAISFVQCTLIKRSMRQVSEVLFPQRMSFKNLDLRRGDHTGGFQEHIPEMLDYLEKDTRTFYKSSMLEKQDKRHEDENHYPLRARRFAIVKDRRGKVHYTFTYPHFVQSQIDKAPYIHMWRDVEGNERKGLLSSELQYVPKLPWATEEAAYTPIEGGHIYTLTPLMRSDLSNPEIFDVLMHLEPDLRKELYNKIPKRIKEDPKSNTMDPFRDIHPVNVDDPNDPGILGLTKGPYLDPWREGESFTAEDILAAATGGSASTSDLAPASMPAPATVDMSTVVEQSYDMSDADQREAIEIAWGASPEYRAFEAKLPNVVDVSEIKAARTYLKDLLSSEGVETRAYTRGRDIRLNLDKSVANAYIRIGDPYLDARQENRGPSPISDDLKGKIDTALGKYATWQARLRDSITDRQIAEMLPAIQEWMTANGISLVNGGLEDLYGLPGDAAVDQSIDADVDLQQRALDEDLEAALRRSDSETAAKIEATKDALAQAHAAYVGAVESGDEATALRVIDAMYSDEGTTDHGEYDEYDEGTTDHGEYDEYDEGTTDHGEYDEYDEGTIDRDPKDSQWGSAEDWARVESLPTDETVKDNVGYALSLIDFDKITQGVIESLYADLDRRYLSKIRNAVKVNPNSGDVYVGAVDGYLEGIALPEGLNFDERRAFVKAVKSFEDRKYNANMEVLAQVASSLGLNNARKQNLLAYPIPQFTVRQDYLNEYVERAQPDEIELLKNEVVNLLLDFEQSPTKSKFNDLAPRIESLFRYDPSNVMYHSFLDRLIEAADATDWWKDSARKRMPLYRRLQSRAAAAYGDKGYVPVIEDPLVGLDSLAERVSDNIIYLGMTDPTEFYELFDPSVYMEFFRESDATDVYLGRNGLYDLPECVGRKINPPQGGDEPPQGGDGAPSSLPGGSGSSYMYSYELFFGNFEKPDARRCEDLKRTVPSDLNDRLEIIADSIFGNMDVLYSLYNLATEVEIDVTYADKTGVRLKSDFDNNIEVALSETFGQADVDTLYRGMCGLLANIINSQEIDLDPDDSDIDADDLLNEMKIPAVTIARPNSSDLPSLRKVLRDLKAISDGDDSVGNLDDLKAAYEDCMKSEIGQWDSSQYVGESAEEADQRRLELAAYIGLGRYLPYDISYALDDSDFKDLLNTALYGWLEVQSTYPTEAEQLDQLRGILVRAYRDIVFPKYFPKDGIRVVHITYKEADDFTREHHSLLGGDSKEINPRGLNLTIGAEVDGKLVAVAVANTPAGRGSGQLRETDLSRVASDGSVKKVSSLLAGIVLQLTLDNKLNRDSSSSPLFITYSTIDEVGSTYMALLNMGLRPVSVSKPAATPSGARQGSEMGDVYAYPKIRWEAGEDAQPANLDIARFLKLSYATEIETDPAMKSVGEPWGDDYICLCILSTVKFSKSCKAYIDSLRKEFTTHTKTKDTLRIRKLLMSYAGRQIDRSGPQRSKNIKRYMRPIKICGQITGNDIVTSEGLTSIRRNIQKIKDVISRIDTPRDCKKADVTKALTSWDKSLNT